MNKFTHWAWAGLLLLGGFGHSASACTAGWVVCIVSPPVIIQYPPITPIGAVPIVQPGNGNGNGASGIIYSGIGSTNFLYIRASSSSSAAHTSNTQQSALSSQETRQVVRLVSNQISNRISSQISTAISPAFNQNPHGASADAASYLPDNAWSSFSWSSLGSNKPSPAGSFVSDIFQFTSGADYRNGNWYLGSAFSYVGSSDYLQTADMHGSSQSLGITPYAAYVLSSNVFVTALTGYHYSNSTYRGAAPTAQSDAYQSEIDLNGRQALNQWLLKGRIGGRYLHNYTRTDAYFQPGSALIPAYGSNSDSWTFLSEGEVGYAFRNGIRPYTGILYEHYTAPNSNIGGVSYNLGNNIFYYHVGADYTVNKKLSLGSRFQTDLNSNAVNLSTLMFNVQLVLD